DGSGYAVLRSFIRNGAEGYELEGGIVEGPDGALYGTTYGGGSGGGGIFKMNRDGTGFAVLHSLAVVEGRRRSVSLIKGTDGGVYGSALVGGDMSIGSVFKLFSVRR